MSFGKDLKLSMFINPITMPFIHSNSSISSDFHALPLSPEILQPRERKHEKILLEKEKLLGTSIFSFSQFSTSPETKFIAFNHIYFFV